MSLSSQINHAISKVVGPNRKAQRKLRLFIGIGAIIIANTALGPVIGQGIAALLGLGVFLVLLDLGED